MHKHVESWCEDGRLRVQLQTFGGSCEVIANTSSTTTTSPSRPISPTPRAAMLDAFEIVTTSGIVLWRKHYAPLSSSVINSLINDVFIEERQKPAGGDGAGHAPYRKDKYTLKYTTLKDAGLIFVVGKRQPQRMRIRTADRFT